MSSALEKLSYKEFLIFSTSTKVEPAFKSFKALTATFGDYDYAGFSPDALLKLLIQQAIRDKTDPSGFLNDMGELCAIFHIRGPNISNITENIKGGEKTFKERLNILLTKYDVKSKASKDPTLVTLPRISATFPFISWKVWTSLSADNSTNNPVREKEIGLTGTQFLAPNYVPSLIPYAKLTNGYQGIAFAIHIVYQTHLGKKTEVPPKSARARTSFVLHSLARHLENACKYSKLACQGAETQQYQYDEFATALAKVIDDDMAGALIEALDNILVTNELKTLDIEPDTKFHHGLLYCTARSVKMSSIPISDWKLSMPDFQKMYKY